MKPPVPKLSALFKERVQKQESLLSSITPTRDKLFEDLVLSKISGAEQALTASEVLLMQQGAERKRHHEFVSKNYRQNQNELLKAIKGMLEDFASYQLLLQSKSYQELESLLKKIEGYPPDRDPRHEDLIRAQVEALMKQAEMAQPQKVTYAVPKRP